MRIKFLLGLILISILHSVHSEKILVATFFATSSHRRIYDPLFNELANRGHDVTVISSIKTSKPNPKIREIEGIMSHAFTKVNFFDVRIMKNNTITALDLGHIVDPICEQTYELPSVKKIIQEKFDLVIVSAFLNECVFGLIHKMGVPYILISPLPVFSTTASFFGAHMPPSFIASPIAESSKDMTFYDRSKNFLFDLKTRFAFYFRVYPRAEGIYKNVLGHNIPSVEEIGRNASLVFINSHFTLNQPRPMMPGMIEVGGMHCRPAEPLPKDLQEYIDGAGEHGVIYFSLGTVVLGHTMPEPIRKMFVNVFSKLKQRVLWKWETETMVDLPPNVRLGKFFPQQDILAHPNVRVFITHGGLLSTEEAVYHGVPLIGIPFFADQDWNMKQSESTGNALTMEINGLTEEMILNTINRILNEPKFKQNALALSAVFKDRPMNPLDTAVFWTEYVMRHKGAPHLRSPGRNLNFIQYHSLDVIGVISFVLLIFTLTLYFVVKFAINLLLKTGGTETGHKMPKAKIRKRNKAE